MNARPDATRRFVAVAHLRAETRRVTDRVVAYAHAARQLGATAEMHRSRARDLDRQADCAAGLLFGQAVETFRAAAAESSLMADALEAIETRKDAPRKDAQ